MALHQILCSITNVILFIMLINRSSTDEQSNIDCRMQPEVANLLDVDNRYLVYGITGTCQLFFAIQLPDQLDFGEFIDQQLKHGFSATKSPLDELNTNQFQCSLRHTRLYTYFDVESLLPKLLVVVQGDKADEKNRYLYTAIVDFPKLGEDNLFEMMPIGEQLRNGTVRIASEYNLRNSFYDSIKNAILFVSADGNKVQQYTFGANSELTGAIRWLLAGKVAQMQSPTLDKETDRIYFYRNNVLMSADFFRLEKRFTNIQDYRDTELSASRPRYYYVENDIFSYGVADRQSDVTLIKLASFATNSIYCIGKIERDANVQISVLIGDFYKRLTEAHRIAEIREQWRVETVIEKPMTADESEQQFYSMNEEESEAPSPTVPTYRSQGGLPPTAEQDSESDSNDSSFIDLNTADKVEIEAEEKSEKSTENENYLKATLSNLFNQFEDDRFEWDEDDLRQKQKGANFKHLFIATAIVLFAISLWQFIMNAPKHDEFDDDDHDIDEVDDDDDDVSHCDGSGRKMKRKRNVINRK